MKLMILIFTVSFINITPQEKSEIIREALSEINIGFLNSKSPDDSKLNHLQSLIDAPAAGTNDDFDLSEVKSLLFTYNELLNSEVDIDSLKKVFRLVNNKFNSVAGNYLYTKLINSSKKKLLVFSTSMSCECTLESCYQQESEVQVFQKKHSDVFEYVVIDIWEYYELQMDYKIGFIPAVIVLNSENSELYRFVRDENLIDKLNTLIYR